MAQNSDTEQKSLPASEKKLRDSRRKGQVSSSRDLISGFGLLAILLYLFMVWPFLRDRVIALVDLTSRMALSPFDDAARTLLYAMVEAVLTIIVPAVALIVLVSIVFGMLGTLGPVFSFETIKPNFDRINPASGLKKIFSMRNVIEFVKSLIKVVLLTSLLFLVLRYWLQAMFYAPNCGENCVTPLLLTAAKVILAVAAFAFVIIGFSDIAIQRWLFLRDMRMTRTEQKRERKDIEGDPLIEGARKRQRFQDSLSPRLGLASASFMLIGNGAIVGLRYNRTDVRIPMIVIKSTGPTVDAIRDAALTLNIPVIEQPELAKEVAQSHRAGQYLEQQHFALIAQILVQLKLV